MENQVIGVMYTDYKDVEDFIALRRASAAVNCNDTTCVVRGTPSQARGLDFTVRYKHLTKNEKSVVSYYYRFIYVDVNSPTHNGMCGMLFNGFHYLPGNYGCDFLNYCQSRVRHGEIM